MREFFKSWRFKILLGVVAVFIGVMLYEASTGGLSAPNGLIGSLTSPVQQGASAVSNGVSGFFDKFLNAGNYKKENEELKTQISELQQQMVDYEKMKEQNEQLKEIAGIKEKHSDFDMEPATVIARDPSDAYGSFTINKGSVHGVKKNDPVITSAGLVGQVTSVGLTYAHVTTLLSPDLEISGYEVHTKDSGVVVGDLALSQEGLCQMQHLSKETSIAKGYIICTAGSSGLFPSDLIIGTVQEIKIQNNGISAYAVIKPTVDVHEVTNVAVLKSFVGQGVNIPGNDSSSSEPSSEEE